MAAPLARGSNHWPDRASWLSFPVMHILITRPQEDAAELAAILAARNIESTVESLLTIRPEDSPVIALDGVQALLFTSANGIRCFAAAEARRDLKVFTVGDNSATEARAAGFALVESAAGDVESLARLVTDRLHPRDGKLLHAAGATLAGDLRGQLQASGFVVERVVLYHAEPAAALSPATVMNLRLGGIDAVTLFSPRTARLFKDLWRRAGDQTGLGGGLGGVTALCLSPAVAREVADLGWQRIETAATPDRAGMLALIAQEMTRGDAAMAETSDGAEKQTAADSMSATGAAEQKDAAHDAARGAAIIAAVPAPRASRTGSLITGLIAGALAGGAVTLAAPYWRPYIAPTTVDAAVNPETAAEIAGLKEQLAALQAEKDIDAEARSRIDALQTEIANWKTELETATGQVSPAPAPTIDLAPLEGRLEALEGRVASLTEALNAELSAAPDEPENAGAITPSTPMPDADAISDLTTRFAALEGKLAALDALSAETSSQKAEIEAANTRLAALDSLATRLQSLEETAATLGSDLDKVAQEQGEASLKQQRAAAMVLSIGQLRGALGADQPFTGALAALEDLARPDAEMSAQLKPILDPVRAAAATGVPTLSQLQASFPATAIAQAATADAAGNAIGVEEGWLQQTLNRLAELITVRPVGDVAGEGALAILARAEDRLAGGDLAAAVAEAEKLSGQAATAASAWIGEARGRLAAEAAATQLTALSAEVLAPAATTPQSN